MNNLYQYFSELISLTSDEQKKYLDNNISDKTIRKALESMLSNQAFDFTALFSDGMSLSNDLVNGDNFIGQNIGKYEITSLIGQGGMGCVFLASRVDGEFEQQVAIKVIPKELFQQTSEQYLNHEAQSLAQLNHPNIVPIFDAGKTDQGAVYIVMRYLDGLSLNHYIKQHSLDDNLKLKLFIKLLDAVSHAHANQIIHRDIKPQNILVDKEGEPSLVDFGIARLIDDGTNPINQAYLKALSFAYASPEQKSGGKVTTASDVFSLGQVLKFIMTEQDPNLLIEEDYTDKKLPESIKAIIKKATCENVAQRYETVAQFKQDIILFIQNKPTQAYENKLHNFKLWFKRNKVAIAASAAIFTAITLSGVKVYSSTLEAQKQAVLADANLKIAENMLKQVDVKLSTETERQQSLVDVAQSIDIKFLPEKQAVRLTKSLADASKAIGNYDAYKVYANNLYQLTQGKSDYKIEHVLARKMLVEVGILYQKFDQAKLNIIALVEQVKELEDKNDPRLIELLDWEMRTLDPYLVKYAIEVYRDIKPFLSAKTTIQQLNIQMFDTYELTVKGEFMVAIKSSEQTLTFAQKHIKDIPIRYWVRQLIIWDTIQNAHDEPSDFSLFEANVMKGLDDMEVLLDKNHPVVTALALTVINRLSARENKAINSLIEHFKDIKLEALVPLFQIDKGIQDLNTYIDNSQYEKAYSLIQVLSDRIPLASADSIPLYQVFSYFVHDFSRYDLVYNNHYKIIKLAEKNNDLSTSSHYNSELCYFLVSKGVGKVENNCKKAVDDAVALYGEDSFWTLEAKGTMLKYYRTAKMTDQAKESFEELYAAKDKFKGTWKMALMANFVMYHLGIDEVEKARIFLDEYNKVVVELSRKYGIVQRLYNSHVMHAEGRDDEAREAISIDISKFCKMWPYDHSGLKEIRRFKKELGIEPFDTCPNATKWEDIVEDENVINQIYSL